MLKQLLQKPVDHFATTDIVKVPPHYTIKESTLLMLSKGFRRLPVVDGQGRLVGLVNSNDILTILYRSIILNQREISHLLQTQLAAQMWTHYSAVPSGTPLIEAIRALDRKCIGCIAIVRDNSLIGLLTERDVTKIAAQQALEQRVLEFMTRELFTQPKSTNLLGAMQYMVEMGIRRIPIVEDNEVTGVVTEKDILTYIFERENLIRFESRGREFLASVKLGECGAGDVHKVFPEAKVSYAASLMISGGKGCLVVHDGKRPRGIITEKDLIRAFLKE